MNIRDYIEKSIELDVRRLEHYRKQYNSIKLKGILIRRTNSEKKKEDYYYRPKGGKEKYLRKSDGKTIVALQHKRLAKEMMERLKHNISQ